MLAGTACFWVFAGPGAFAQEDTGVTVLEPVTVTSTKRSEEIGKVDAAVTVVSGAELEERGIRTVEGLQKVFPGLTMGNRGNRIYANVTVRGLSSPDYFNPTVQVLVDGIPQAPSTFSQPLVDVEQVEFLRGPQGTLYGANAYGGVINIVTRENYRNTAYIEANASPQEPYGKFGGTVELVPDTLYFDYAGLYSYYAGDIDDVATGKDNINSSRDGAARFALRYAPLEGNFDASLIYSREKLETHEEIYVLQEDVDDRDYNSAFYGDYPLLKRDMTNVAGQWSYTFGDFTLTSITTFQESDVTRDFSSGAGTRYIWPQDERLFTQDLRLTYDGLRFSGVGGLWYSHDDFSGWKNGYPGYYGDSKNNVVTDSYAAYGETTWHATDRLDLTAGLRATYERSKIDAWRQDSYATGYGFDFENSADFSGWQPKVAVGYELTPDVRLYGVISRGYKPGGFNHSISSIIDAEPYEAESNWNFETGLRSTLFDDTLDLSASLYYIRSKDMQFYVGPIGQQFIENAGEAYSTGLEVDATWRPTHRFTLSGVGAFGRAEFLDYTNSYTGISYDGNRVPYAPDVTAHVNAAFLLTEDLFDGGSLVANLGVNYTSKTYFDDANSTGQDAYATVDASLDFEGTNGLFAQLYVQNLTNESYKTSGYASGGYELGTLGQARTFGLTVRKEF